MNEVHGLRKKRSNRNLNPVSELPKKLIGKFGGEASGTSLYK